MHLRGGTKCNWLMWGNDWLSAGVPCIWWGYHIMVQIRRCGNLQSLSPKHRTKSLTHQTGNYPVTCFVSRPSGITLVKFHSLQVTIKTNILSLFWMTLVYVMELRLIADPSLQSLSFCREQGRVFVWSFQLWHLRVVSGYRRNIGYFESWLPSWCVCLFGHSLVPYPAAPTIKTWKSSVRGLTRRMAGCTVLMNSLLQQLRSCLLQCVAHFWNCVPKVSCTYVSHK